MIRRRHVYHLAGYDPIDPASQQRRFVRQLAILKRTWNVDATVSALERDHARAWWRVNAHAANWQVEAVHELMGWDDIIRADLAGALPARLVNAARAYLDFIVTGTMFRYIMANQRYAGFFLFPLFQLALFAAVAGFVAWFALEWLGLTGSGAATIGAVIALAVFIALLHWPGRRWGVQHALDDWIFSWQVIHGRRADVDARIDQFAEALVARSREGALDEIIVVGHSMGASLVLDVVARALARDPQLGRHGPDICVLTVGSTIPKFTLHPAGERFRRCAARIAEEPSIAWVEYQVRSDAISFYKFDPLTLRHIDGDRFDKKPVIRRVQLHQMLERESRLRHRHRVMRVHYQVVMANEQRATYDYLLMVCSPARFTRWTMSLEGLLDFIAADGSYREIRRCGAVAVGHGS
jgi:pimeloyl-ACP methyl ester carboxylesterase